MIKLKRRQVRETPRKHKKMIFSFGGAKVRLRGISTWPVLEQYVHLCKSNVHCPKVIFVVVKFLPSSRPLASAISEN